jgi:WD40 repeat protein
LLADNHLLVGAMTADEYRRAIVSPALRVGAVVEPELVEALVNDVLGEPGALPLLSTTLLELWDARSGRTLTAASYEQLGGVHGAVARMADTAYEALSEAQQEAARRSLLRLAGPGDGDSVVRRRVPVSDFDGDQEAAEVLRTLTDRRLLTVSDGYVEVAHEALLREWPRFRGWLEEDREGLRLRAHLATAAAAWIASGRDTGELYRGARLAAALDWTTQHSLDLNNVEREFVTNSRDESQQALRRQQRQNRRLRGLLSGVAVLLVVALIAGVVAIVQRRHARHDATVALARSVGATAVSTPRIDEAMLLARQAVLFNRSPQTDSTLLSTVLRAPTLEHTFTVPNTVRPQRVYLSSDDRMLAELGNDGTWRFFNAATGRSILRPLPNIVDGNWVGRDFFTASVDRSGKFPTIVWSLYTVGHTLTKVATMQSSHALNALPTGQPLTFGSPDGKYFYTAYPVVAPDTGDNVGGYVDRWSVSSHRRQELKLPAAGVNAFAFTGGNRLAILTDSSEVSIDTARWRITRNRHVAGLPSQTLAALSPDGTRAAYVPVNTPDSFVVKDLSSGAIRRPAGGHSADIESLGFSPNGRLLITAGDDGTAREWDATSLSSVEILNGDSGRVLSEAFSNDSQTLFTCSLDGSIFEWALGDGNRFGRPIALAHPITAPEPLSARPALAFSPDGKQVVASILTGGAEVARVSLSNGLTRVATIGSLSRRVTAVAWSAGGTIATGSDHGVQLWQAPYLSPELSLTTSPGIAAALAFSHDGRNLIVGTGGQATLSDNPTEAGWIDGYTTASGQPLFPPVNLKHPVIALALSPDDRLIAASLDDGTVRILKADDGQPVAQFRVAGFTTGPAISLAFASNGDLLIGSFVGLVQRVNPKTGAELGPPVLSEPAPVSSISISPDGAKFVTTGGSSGGMRLWDSRTFQQVGSDFPGGESHWANAVFSPDGTTAIDLYDDGTGTIWPVTDSALMAHACAVARRNLTQEEWRRFVQGASYRRTCPQFG